MGKVIPFRPMKKAAFSRKPEEADLNKALARLYDDTGIDFLKVITGDEKENKRLKFKQYQDALKFQ